MPELNDINDINVISETNLDNLNNAASLPAPSKKPDILLIILPIIAVLSFLFLVVFDDKDTIKSQNFKETLFGQQQETTIALKNKPELSHEIDATSLNKLFEETQKKVSTFPGTYGLYIKDMGSGISFKFNSNTEFYAASLYKLPLAAAVLKDVERGKLNLDTKITYYPYDYSAGTGSISKFEHGTELTVEELLSALMKQSDNTAQNMLLRVTQYDQVKNAFLINGIDKERMGFYNLNLTNPYEMGTMVENIFYGDYLLDSSREYLLNIMYPTDFDDRISPYIGAGYIFKHKIGSWPDSWHDCGIVYGNNREVVVCLMSKDATLENFIEVCKEVGAFINKIIG